MASTTVTSLHARPQRCRVCRTVHEAAPIARCSRCDGPLDPTYDGRSLPDRHEIAARPPTLWRYRELLPFDGEPVLSLDSGFTPLVDAPRLARELGVERCWVKNDGVSHPTLSFKDRVVAMAINAAHAFGIETLACPSTGNLGNALAAHAARAGLAAWVLIPDDLELGKVLGSAIYAPRLVRVRGTYDEINRLCADLAASLGWGVVNGSLRGYYAEGSKTMAFEIAEQLGWRLPGAVVCPMAGGSLVSKLRQGFGELLDAGLVSGTMPRIFGAQAEGCAPIVRLVERGGDAIVPEVPRTIARSIAIGNPVDGVWAALAIRESGGGAQAVSDRALVAGIRLLAETTGIFTETAGGVTVAAARELVRREAIGGGDEIVLCMTGNGLKTTEAVRDELPDAPVIGPSLDEVLSLMERDG